MNLDSWNRLSPEAQEQLEAQFSSLEEQFWQMSADLTTEAVACNTGGEPCNEYRSFDMTLMMPSEEDEAFLREAVSEVILPTWAQSCEASYPGCTAVWNETVGAARGYTIE